MPESADSNEEDGVVIVLDAALPENRDVSLVYVDNGPSILSLSPERASRLRLSDQASVTRSELSARLQQSDIILNEPDNLFYLPLAAQSALRGESRMTDTRPLTESDAAVFSEFTERAPEDDLDEAYVELDHWLVFGTFVDGKLVSAASMYPWSGTQLADLGVITLPDFRGRGLGRATVRALCAEALTRGYEPQYRCQLDNAASVALATAAGFSRFGEWEVIVPGN